MAGLLEVEDLSKSFGALKAVEAVNLTVRQGAVHSIIGPNGAGKTTLFNLLAGEFRPTRGTIRFKDRDVTAARMDQRCLLGIGRSYQVTSVFKELSVRENVRLAVQAKSGHAFSMLRDASTLAEVEAKTDEVLGRMRLTRLQDFPAGAVSYGNQRSLDVAMALATEPDLLLLDEPTSGMPPEDISGMIRLVEELSERYTIVLIEHHMSVVMSISDTITVLQNGQVIAEGLPEDIKRDEAVKQAYLGDEP